MDLIQLRIFAESYTAAWCSQIPERVAAHYSPNGSLCINGGTPAEGRAAITEVAGSFMTAFPDLQVMFDAVEVEKGFVRYRWTLMGTNSGPGGSGRSLRISGYEEWQFGDDGLIAASLGHFDAEGYQRQLEGVA